MAGLKNAPSLCNVKHCLRLRNHREIRGFIYWAPYCKHHSCAAFDMENKRYCDALIQFDDKLCGKHRKCLAPDCEETPADTPDASKPWTCSRHAWATEGPPAAKSENLPVTHDSLLDPAEAAEYKSEAQRLELDMRKTSIKKMEEMTGRLREANQAQIAKQAPEASKAEEIEKLPGAKSSHSLRHARFCSGSARLDRTKPRRTSQLCKCTKSECKKAGCYEPNMPKVNPAPSRTNTAQAHQHQADMLRLGISHAGAPKASTPQAGHTQTSTPRVTICESNGCSGTSCAGNLERFCPKHRCQAVFCPQAALTIHGACRDHTCHTNNCNKPGFELTHLYCKDHLCQANGCLNPRRAHSAFCQDKHACAAPGGSCTGLAHIPGGFCLRHSCIERGCHRLIRAPNTVYCEAHVAECVMAGCERHAVDADNQVCSHHRCQVQGCGRHVKYLDARHCEEHRCRQDRCWNQAKTRGGFCGEKHGCKWEGCGRQRSGRRVLAELCEAHHLATMKQVQSGEETSHGGRRD